MKKKIITLIILISLALLVVGIIYMLSDMNSTNSNGSTTNIIYNFIEKTLGITNGYGITNSNPSGDKIEHASKLLNTPFRKLIHASVYFVLAFFIILIFSIIFDHRRYVLSLILSILLCIFLSTFDELHQTYVEGRTGQVMDVVIDNIGATCGCLFYTSYYIVYNMGKKSKSKN